jgi:hypothetical protein
MSTALRENLSRYWFEIQQVLFPHMAEVAGPLTKHHQQLISVLEFTRIEELIRGTYGAVGRPEEDRRAIFRAFIAKAVFNLSTTVLLREYLLNDQTIRRICGFFRRCDVPSESTFSRAFRDFAKMGLPDRVHAMLIEKHQSDRLVGHISRDATAVEARERVDPVRKESMIAKATAVAQKSAHKPKKGRPKKGEARPPVPLKRLERQLTMTLKEMLSDLPNGCDIGTKRNSKGHTTRWKGYKLHLDTADGGIPISALLTSASVHDSQAAIPLATLTAQRVTSCYDVMDAAYDSEIIRNHSVALKHVPLIDFNRRNPKDTRAFDPCEAERYKERSVAERMNARLKDEFGGRTIYVRGALKIKAHLMFGIISLTVDQLIRLIQ